MGTVFQKLKIYSQEREFSRNGNCSVAEIAVVTLASVPSHHIVDCLAPKRMRSVISIVASTLPGNVLALYFENLRDFENRQIKTYLDLLYLLCV